MSEHTNIAGITGEPVDLVVQLDHARPRLDESVRLLNRALDLREQLWLGLDLDDMVDQVAALKRACRGAWRAP